MLYFTLTSIEGYVSDIEGYTYVGIYTLHCINLSNPFQICHIQQPLLLLISNSIV